ncbi:MAG TPA: hypothetical protein VJY34_06225 [Roseiarcus sp.]|nr:hypothetical protein [Roseiarcus sp.]
MNEPPEDRDDERPRSRANIAALIAIVVLALLGSWAFTAIDKQRKLQKCLDEGRRNCMEIVSPSK